MTSFHIEQDDEMGDVIVLDQPIIFACGVTNYIVPIGFRSDGMSIPKFFWRILSPQLDFKTLVPSICHDWLYETKSVSRKEADDLYYDMLVANGFGKIKSKLVWLGVRLGGSSHYNKENGK